VDLLKGMCDKIFVETRIFPEGHLDQVVHQAGSTFLGVVVTTSQDLEGYCPMNVIKVRDNQGHRLSLVYWQLVVVVRNFVDFTQDFWEGV